MKIFLGVVIALSVTANAALTMHSIDFASHLDARSMTPEATNDARVYAASSGYFALNGTNDAHLFYTLFERRNAVVDASASPLIVWLTGGPGCSSELASLYENGPYALERRGEDAVLTRRAHAWNDAGHLLYVDSPVGTGFSYSSSRRDAARDEVVVAEDLLLFLYAFFLRRPDLADVPVFVTGESYAGHYVPAFAHRIFVANQKEDGPVRINLRGVAVGNGLTDPEIQYGAYADFSLGNDIVSADAAEKAMKAYPGCRKAIEACAAGGSGKANRATCVKAVDECQTIPETLLEDAASRLGGKQMNVYDIRKTCDAALCYDFSDAERWLNRPDVQKALGVNKKWEMCDSRVHADLMGDWMHAYVDGYIPPLLEAGIRVMIYAGDQDFICNALGNERWVKAMRWTGQEEFNAARTEPFVVSSDDGDDIVGGSVREAGQLSFVKVGNAGHMVPMDQPRNGLTMIQRFVNGEPIARGATPERSAPRRAAVDSLRVAMY